MIPRILIAVALVVSASFSTPAAADPETPSPKKGDTVFIALDLPRVVQNGTPAMSMTLPGMMAGPGVDQMIAAAKPAMPLVRLVCDNTGVLLVL